MTVVIVIVIVVAVVVVLVGVGAIVARRRRGPDGVAQFQRHIGALSPEARRPVVDRVQRLEDGTDGTGTRDRDQGRDV